MSQSNKEGLVLPPLARGNMASDLASNIASSIAENIIENNIIESNAAENAESNVESNNVADNIAENMENSNVDTLHSINNANSTQGTDPQFTDEEDDIEHDLIHSIQPNNDNTQNTQNNNVREEIVHDNNQVWVPVHYLRKTKAKFWTHYLALDKSLTILRCKHCSTILEKFSNSQHNNESLQNTKKFQRHLKIKHNLNPLISYYKNNEDTLINLNASSNQPSQKSKSLPFLNQHNNNNELNAQQRQVLYPFPKLMAIIIASQNLSSNFITDPIMKLLYNKLSLSHSHFIPDPSIIKQSITTISTQINEIIKRTAQRNDLDLQLIIDMDHLPLDLNDRTSLLTERLKFFLNEINKITLFSITSSTWDSNNSLTNVLALNFWDANNESIKTIPLNVKLSKSSSINTVTIRNQLLDVLINVKGLNKSILSMTLPPKRLRNMRNIDQSDFFHQPSSSSSSSSSSSPYHNCIVEILADIIKPIFGTLKGDDDDDDNNINTHMNPRDQRTKFAYSNDPENHLLDSCVNLNDINIPSNNNTSIFNRIETFYNEIQSNPWQLERFNQLYKEKFHENNDPILLIFDPNFYSTAQLTLTNFLKLKEIIKETQHFLQIEKFNDSDFKLISIINEFLTSINQIIIYFTSTKKLNFIYIIFTILSIEKQLIEMIDDCKTIKNNNNHNHNHNLIKTLNEIKVNVKNYKDILLKDETNLLALFCCPATLFDREVLEYVFQTVSLSDIVNIIGTTIRDIIKRFINIEFITNQNGNQHPTTNDDEDDADTNQNHQFFNGNENKIIEDEIDIILTQIINEDLYDYLSTVNTIVPLSYKAYCEQSDYVRDEGRFKRKRQQSDEYEHTTTLEEEAEDEEIEMNHVEQLLDIHIPVCNAFWDQYLANDAGLIIKLLSKIMLTESATSRRSEYEFLNNFIPKLGNEYLEDIVKIKLFNEQYSAGKVDYDVDTLATAAQYD